MQYCITLEGLEGAEDLQFQIVSMEGGSFLIDNLQLQATCTEGVQIANVWNTQDYYPGGSLLPGRTFTSNDYRYGYQGSEKDDEITGVTGAHINTTFRELDTRLLRWWSIDPKANASESPYMSMGGNPIWYNDPLGDTIKINYLDADGKGQTHTYTPGEGFTGNKYLDQSIDALNTLYSKKAGSEIVGTLHGAEETFSITPDLLNLGNVSDASGVRWNTQKTFGGIDQTGSTSRPPFVALGHELAHVLDHYKGTIDQSTWYTTPKGSVPNAEKYATHMENRIRAEHGLSLRTHYGLIKDASGTFRGNPKSRIINGRQSLFYKTTSQIQILNIDGGLIDDGADKVLYQGEEQVPYTY